MPRPTTRRLPRVDPEEPDDPEALRGDEAEVGPEALRELLLALFLDRLLLVPVDPRPLPLPLLELLLPLDELLLPLALIPPRPLPVPPLLRFGMMILR